MKVVITYDVAGTTSTTALRGWRARRQMWPDGRGSVQTAGPFGRRALLTSRTHAVTTTSRTLPAALVVAAVAGLWAWSATRHTTYRRRRR